MEPTCPQCHVSVRPTDFFCYNCGKKLHEGPPLTSIEEQIKLYLGSLFLPPLGIIWGWKYLKSADPATRRIGLIAFALTALSLFLVMRWTINFINSINSQVNTQLQGIEGL